MSTERSQAESLDEQSLALDPLETGAEPPERWAEANRHGMTPNEAREGEGLDARLAQEEPDDQPRPDQDRPVDEVPSDADRHIGATEELPVEDLPVPQTESVRNAADDAGGSVARSLRE